MKLKAWNAMTYKEKATVVADFAVAHPEAFLAMPVVAQAIADARESGRRAGTNMKIPPATLQQLQDAFPNDLDFIMDRSDRPATLAEHKIAFADHLQRKLRWAEQEIRELAIRPNT